MKKSEEKINRIKEVAYSLFLDIGYEATTVRMICREANIEPPTLYHFFNSKQGLFFEVRDDLVDEYKEKVLLLNLKDYIVPIDAMRKYYEFCIKYTKENIDKTRFYIRHTLFIPKELEKEVVLRMLEIENQKHKLYGGFIKSYIEECNSKLSYEKAFEIYTRFIDQITFSIVFSKWLPSYDEIEKNWSVFINEYLI